MADGSLPIWSATEQPETSQQRCWNHKIINVLDNLPKRIQTEARQLLTQIPYAPSRHEAETLRDEFAARYRDQFPEAVGTLERDWERMVTFYDFPESTGRTCARRIRWRVPLLRCDCGPTPANATNASRVLPP